MKITRLLSKLRFSEQSVYIFCDLKKKERAMEAMKFHEKKIIFQTLLVVGLVQIFFILLISFLGMI